MFIFTLGMIRWKEEYQSPPLVRIAPIATEDMPSIFDTKVMPILRSVIQILSTILKKGKSSAAIQPAPTELVNDQVIVDVSYDKENASISLPLSRDSSFYDLSSEESSSSTKATIEKKLSTAGISKASNTIDIYGGLRDWFDSFSDTDPSSDDDITLSDSSVQSTLAVQQHRKHSFEEMKAVTDNDADDIYLSGWSLSISTVGSEQYLRGSASSGTNGYSLYHRQSNPIVDIAISSNSSAPRSRIGSLRKHSNNSVVPSDTSSTNSSMFSCNNPIIVTTNDKVIVKQNPEFDRMESATIEGSQCDASDEYELSSDDDDDDMESDLAVRPATVGPWIPKRNSWLMDTNIQKRPQSIPKLFPIEEGSKYHLPTEEERDIAIESKAIHMPTMKRNISKSSSSLRNRLQ